MATYKATQKELDWFRDNPENYRHHPPEQLAVLRESLKRFGIFRNVVAKPDGTLLAGHGIIAAAREEGMDKFPCVIFTGTDAEARALMVADNEQARMAENDDAQLSTLLSELAADGLLDVTGHDDDSLKKLLENMNAEDDATPKNVDDAAEKWMILINCNSEAEQADFLERFMEEGLDCRALIG